MKNDTVIGIIGNTQGVSSMAKPQRIASMMSPHSPSLFCPPSSSTSGSEIAVLCAATSSAEIVSTAKRGVFLEPETSICTENSQYSGAAQNLSLQPLHLNSPFITAAPSAFTFCATCTLPKNTFSPLSIDGFVSSYSSPSIEYPGASSNSTEIGLLGLSTE